MKNCDKIHIERMAKTISNNKTRDLFKEFSKIKCRNNFAPSNVDGFNNELVIEQVLVLNIKIVIIVYNTTEREWSKK